MKLAIGACLTLVATAVLNAETVENCPSWCTDYLVASDTKYDKSSLLNGDNWNSQTVPGVGSTNYVGAGYTVWGPTKEILASQPFEGDCFALAGNYKAHSGAVNWNDLRMLDGGGYSWASGSALKGLVTIDSGIDAPSAFAYFFGNGYGSTDFSATFVGNADSAFRLERTTKGQPKEPSPDHYFRITGDWSGFLGTATVATNAAIAFLSTASAGNRVAGGKISVERGGYWYGLLTYGYPASVYTVVGTLELQDGSHYWAKVDNAGRASLVVVEDELVLGETEVAFYDEWTASSKTKSTLPGYEITGEVKIPLFKLTSAAAETDPDLTKVKLPDYPEGQRLGGILPENKALVCVSGSDGTKTIYAKYWQEIDWTMNTANGQTGYADSALNPANASFWKNDDCPASDDTGTAYVPKAMLWQGEDGNASFDYPNVKFIIGANQYFYCSHVNASNLIVKTGSIFLHKGSSVKHIDGRLTILSGDSQIRLYGYQGRTLHLDAELCGDGSLDLRPDANANPTAFWHLNADNMNFHGRLTVSHSFNNATHGVFPNPEKNWFTTVYLRNGGSLGGTYSGSDAWSAVTLGSYTKLKIPDDVAEVTIDEPTRGIFITKQCVQIAPNADQTLTVKSPVTYGGRLRKLGEGRLALGGEARFIDGDIATDPQEGTNVLEVAAGVLEVLSTNAIDGVQVEFSGTGTLAINADSDSDGFAEYGFVNTRWSVPFVTADGGAVPVKVEGVPEGGTASVAICTVTSEAAKSLAFKVANVPHCFKSVAKRENEDGTVTFVASFKPSSLRIHIR